jgi:diguanylate cyclase (GGDEF)-like protein
MKQNNLPTGAAGQQATAAGTATLSDRSALAAWLDKHGELKREALLLFEHLSPEDVERLKNMMRFVADLEQSLIDRTVELHNENTHLRSLALVDNLTGLYNSRYFSTQLDIELARTRRTGLGCCLLMIDLDNFKVLNDTLGHIEGNRFLVEFGKTLRKHVRPTDIVCRYGGDEFAVIMPATGLFDACRTAERLRKAVCEMPKPGGVGLSTSIGAAEYNVTSSCLLDEFIHLADSAMYDAKKNGKNQVSTLKEAEKTRARFGPVGREEREELFALYTPSIPTGGQYEKR